MESKDICAICAWRKDCVKKFSLSGKDLRCADFSKDITIGQKGTPEPDTDKKKDK